MDSHTAGTILINAPITFVWNELWDNFLEDNQFTKGSNITKSKADHIQRTITINEEPQKQNIERHEKQKTVKINIVDGKLYGEYTYEIEQSPKGEVYLKLHSNLIDESKRQYPTQEALEYELALQKDLIEHKFKHPKRKGIFC